VLHRHRFHTVGINGYVQCELEAEVITPSLADHIEGVCLGENEWSKVGIDIEV